MCSTAISRFQQSLNLENIASKKKRSPKSKKGERKIGGNLISFDSSYEANFARFLQHLKEKGEILAFVKNTTKFPFSETVDLSQVCKTGTIQRSYTPDFLVFYPDWTYTVFEIKGWMNKRDDLKKAQFEKDYSGLKLEYVRKKDLLQIQNSLTLPWWEEIR